MAATALTHGDLPESDAGQRHREEFRFEGDAVYIKKSGSAVVLIPLVNSWDSLLGSLDKFTTDYMVDRDQPRQQQREAVFE